MKNNLKHILFIFIGFLFGGFILLPINEYTSYFEYNLNSGLSANEFVHNQLIRALTFETPIKLIFYMIFGGIIGAAISVAMAFFKSKNNIIFQLKKELEKDLLALISKGEDDNLEFKSSFRYDYRLEKINKSLETVIIKTLAGFMNAQGGSLLIGVADNGEILGLEADYNTLHRKDQDGLTQLIMTSIADKLGTPACRLVRILFLRHNDKEVCRIIVIPAPFPIYAKEDEHSKFYIRTASGTREMDIQEAISFIKAKWE